MRSIIVGTAGHIDHGKSSLVKALTGTDPDRLKEEKARGITIDLGFAHVDLDAGVTVSFVDVPGHERFVRTMLAGAGGIDAVLLVVAADESVMPQTREHFDICRVLGVAQGIVVVTKADAVDADTLELVTLEVRDLVAGSFLEGAPVLPVSSVTGHGLDALRAALVAIAGGIAPRPDDGVARLPVDRAFTMRGFGTVVTGTLMGGRIAVDDTLEVLPAGRVVKVRGLHVHGRSRTDARAGERVALNLAGVEVADVARGAVLAPPGALRATRRVDAEVTLLDAAAPLKHGARVRVHHGTAEVLGRVSVAGHEGLLRPGQATAVRMRLESPAVLARGDRFILRTYSPLATIGGGVVLDPDPPRAGVRTPRGAGRVGRLRLRPGREEDLEVAVREMTAAAGLAGQTAAALGQRTGAPVAAVRAALDRAQAGQGLLVSGGWAVSQPPLQEAVRAMLQGLDDFHRQHPLADGVPREEARGRWFAKVPAAVFERLLADLAQAGTLAVRDTLARPAHRVALSTEDAAVAAAIDARFLAGGLTPPDAAGLGAELGQPQAAIDRLVPVLVKQRRLQRLDTLVFHADALHGLKQEMKALKAAAGAGQATIDVKAFKDRYGVTRKFAIPLLEYLDRERVTRRAGDARLLL